MARTVDVILQLLLAVAFELTDIALEDPANAVAAVAATAANTAPGLSATTQPSPNHTLHLQPRLELLFIVGKRALDTIRTVPRFGDVLAELILVRTIDVWSGSWLLLPLLVPRPQLSLAVSKGALLSLWTLIADFDVFAHHEINVNLKLRSGPNSHPP